MCPGTPHLVLGGGSCESCAGLLYMAALVSGTRESPGRSIPLGRWRFRRVMALTQRAAVAR